MINPIIKNTHTLNGLLFRRQLFSSSGMNSWREKANNVIYLSGLALTTTTFFIAYKYFSKPEIEQLEKRLTIVQKLIGYLENEQKLLQEDLLKRKSSKP